MRLRAVAGGKGGSWYVLMEGIARLVEAIRPELRIDPLRAPLDGRGPLHPGAARYFREKGLIAP